MGQILIPGGGEGTGVYSGDLTATKGDVLKGKSYVGSDTGDEAGTGTLELTGNAGTGDVLAGKGFYATDPKTKLTGALALTGNITAQRVLSGYTGYATDPKIKITGAIPSYSGRTITPGTSNQTIAAGNYLSGNVVILGDGDLVAGNIRAGVNIFGVTGNVARYRDTYSQPSTVGSKSFACSDGVSRNYYYLTVNPGFTPKYFVAMRIGNPSIFTCNTPWNKIYPVQQAQTVYEVLPSSASLTSSLVEIPVKQSGQYNVWIMGTG